MSAKETIPVPKLTLDNFENENTNLGKNNGHLVNISTTIKEKTSPKNDTNDSVFYEPVYNKQGEICDVKILNVEFIDLLYSWGIRRYDMDSEFFFIKVIDNVIERITNQQILDEVIEYIDSLPDVLSHPDPIEINKKLLKEKIFKSPQTYNSDQKLAQLKNKEIIEFVTDTKTETYIFYQNGFVLCTKDGWELKPYSQLKRHIWKDQIIKRNFIKEDIEGKDLDSLSVFARFMYNVSGNKIDPKTHERRFESLKSIVGNLLSSNMDMKLKATILTDSTVDEASNGRTGKTLLGETLQHIKKLTQIPGKDFDPTNKNKYQQADLDTQIIFLNDVRPNFDFQVLYNDIPEGIKVEKKNKNPFVIKVKMCISTNKTIKIEGGSSEDRCIEFEFSDYYKAGFGPDNEFGHRFFTEWNSNQWNQFDNFMMYCISVFLKNGIIEPENINLNRRKLLDETDREFVYFMDKKTGIIKEEIPAILIPSGVEISKHDLHAEFLTDNPSLREHRSKGKLATFTKWIMAYVKYDKRFYKDYEDRRSGANSWYKLYYK